MEGVVDLTLDEQNGPESHYRNQISSIPHTPRPNSESNKNEPIEIMDSNSEAEASDSDEQNQINDRAQIPPDSQCTRQIDSIPKSHLLNPEAGMEQPIEISDSEPT